MLANLNLFDLAQEEGIIVDWFPFRPPLLGYYWCTNSGQAVIGLCEEIQNDKKATRSILAEELGHHYTSAGRFTTQHHYRYRNRLNVSRCEEKALRWAVETLIPLDELQKAYSKGITNPWDLADYFDVLEETIHFRLKIAQLKGELKRLIKYICDECEKEVENLDFPESWVTMIDKTAYSLEEKHFCSWSCLRDYRQREDALLKKKVI